MRLTNIALCSPVWFCNYSRFGVITAIEDLAIYGILVIYPGFHHVDNIDNIEEVVHNLSELLVDLENMANVKRCEKGKNVGGQEFGGKANYAASVCRLKHSTNLGSCDNLSRHLWKYNLSENKDGGEYMSMCQYVHMSKCQYADMLLCWYFDMLIYQYVNIFNFAYLENKLFLI